MYGDGTWEKLFPDQFDDVDSVTSFFVSDHTEVSVVSSFSVVNTRWSLVF